MLPPLVQHRELCRACLTPRAGEEPQCAACGAPFPAERARRGFPFVVLFVALVGLGVAGWRIARPRDDAPPRAAPAGIDVPAAAPVAVPAVTPAPAEPPAAGPARRVLATLEQPEFEPALPALALRAESGTTVSFLLPLGWLDPEDRNPSLRGAGEVDLRVATWGDQPPHLLLALDRKPELDCEPALPRASHQLAAGEPLELFDAAGARRGVRRLGAATAEGLRRLDEAAPAGFALLDRDGRAVGLTVGDDLALTVDPVLLWIGRPGTTTIPAVRAAMRARDPGHLAARAAELVRSGTAEACREALALLDQAIALERDRDELELLGRHAVAAWIGLLQALSATDAAAALREARQALAAHPTDAELLALGAQIAVVAGDAAAGATWFRRLGADEQGRLARRVARGLAELAQKQLTAGELRPALETIEEGLLLFPEDAQLLRLRRSAIERLSAPADPGATTVEIPFDPDSRVLETDVRIGGQALRMIVDTGATLTTIPVDLARRLGLLDPGNRRVRIETASGIVEGEVVRLPELQIGGLRIDGARAVVHDLPGTLAGSGLLGLNVLGRLDLQIDSRRDRLILRQDVAKRHR
jgi:clan AA aspartic protease (TIGR02281 family)